VSSSMRSLKSRVDEINGERRRLDKVVAIMRKVRLGFGAHRPRPSRRFLDAVQSLRLKTDADAAAAQPPASDGSDVNDSSRWSPPRVVAAFELTIHVVRSSNILAQSFPDDQGGCYAACKLFGNPSSRIKRLSRPAVASDHLKETLVALDAGVRSLRGGGDPSLALCELQDEASSGQFRPHLYSSIRY
jgi:hypothetical protein